MSAAEPNATGEQDVEIAPCLENHPLAEAGRELVDSAHSLGDSAAATALRAWCVPTLFEAHERILAEEREPISELRQILTSLAGFLREGARAGMAQLPARPSLQKTDYDALDVEATTGEHYGRLFERFSAESWWEEPRSLLESRLRRNGLDVEDLVGRSVLDAGCGGGRYSVAWRLLGAGAVVGVDISNRGIRDARSRAHSAGIDHVRFVCGNVLQLPFEDSRFDLVFSNGVLHHSVDWRRGVAEAVRVLKPGGVGWLYLIENPGGLFWDMIEILRVVLRQDSRPGARAALRAILIPANRIFYMLDHVMVPINLRLKPKEVEAALLEAGASGIRRLERGADFDRIERIYRGDPYAEVHFGVGENRYVFGKP